MLQENKDVRMNRIGRDGYAPDGAKMVEGSFQAVVAASESDGAAVAS